MTDKSNILDFNTAAVARAPMEPAAWEARLEHLRATLAARADQMVRDVFPAARHHGGQARIGNLDGDPGESLAINLATGEWFDHATGEGGDLIKLWQITQGYGQGEFPKAVDDLERWAGLTSAPVWTSPVAKLAEKRKAEAAARPKTDNGLGPPIATYLYYSTEGALLGGVRRYHLNRIDPETGRPEKTFRQFNGAGEPKSPDPRPLYRLPQIKDANTVVFVEGEKCADALASVGIEATSAMGGANTLLEKTDLSPLAGKRIFLWPDNDGEGPTEAKSYQGQKFMARVDPLLRAIGCEVSTVQIPSDKPVKWDAADAVAEGADIGTILATAEEKASETPSTPLRFKILNIDELFDIRPPEWRIAGIFPTHGLSTVYGAYESFKTFVALDMLLSLSVGRDWFGRDAKPCPVLYIAGEGQHGIAQRVFGWKEARNHGENPTRFRALPESVAIPSLEDTDDLLRAIEAMPEPPGVIALDTITRMSGGGSLNDEKDMQKYVQGLDRLRIRTGAHIMNVGHSGKDKEKGLLGSIVLPAAMETIICVERKMDSITLVNTNPKGKQKDGPNFEDIRLVTRKAPFERGGDAYQTLVLMPDEGIIKDDTTPAAAQRLGPLQQRIVTALEQAARGGRSTLGFMSLRQMTGFPDKGNLGGALRKLVEKGVIEALGEEGNQQWKLL